MKRPGAALTGWLRCPLSGVGAAHLGQQNRVRGVDSLSHETRSLRTRFGQCVCVCAQITLFGDGGGLKTRLRVLVDGGREVEGNDGL